MLSASGLRDGLVSQSILATVMAESLVGWDPVGNKGNSLVLMWWDLKVHPITSPQWHPCTLPWSAGVYRGQASESEIQAGGPHDGELVDTLEGEAVEIEDVLAVVKVGDAHVDFKN